MGLQPVACHVILCDLWPDTIKTTWWFRPVIANLGYAYPQGYETGHLGVCEKNCIMAERDTFVNSIRQDTCTSQKAWN